MRNVNYKRVPGSDSALLKVMSVLPNRYRPIVLAYEVYAAWRNRQRMHEAKQSWEAEYNQKLTRLQEKQQHKRGGFGLGRLILGAAVTYGISQLLKTQNKGPSQSQPRVRSTGIMPERETVGTRPE